MHRFHTRDADVLGMDTEPRQAFRARRRHAVDRVNRWRKARSRHRWAWLRTLTTPPRSAGPKT